MKKIYLISAATAVVLTFAAATSGFSLYSGHCKVTAETTAPTWIPNSYDSAVNFLNGSSINAASAENYFVIAEKSLTSDGKTYTMELENSGKDVYQLSQSTYKSTDGSESVVVEILNYSSVSYAHDQDFVWTVKNSLGKVSEKYSGTLGIGEDGKITSVKNFSANTVVNYDFANSIWKDGGAITKDGTFYVVRPAEASLKFTVNGNEIAPESIKSDDGSNEYYLYSYKPASAENIKAVVTCIKKDYAGAYYLVYDGNGNFSQGTAPTETTAAENTTAEKIWYPTDEKSAAEFYAKYETGAAYSGNLAVFCVKSSEVTGFNSLLADGLTSHEETYGDYKVFFVEASKASNGTVTEIGSEYNTVFSLESSEENSKIILKITSATKTNNIDLTKLTYEQADKIAGGEDEKLVFYGSQAAYLRKTGDTMLAYDVLSRGGEVDSKDYLVTKSGTEKMPESYQVIALTAKKAGDIVLRVHGTPEKAVYITITDDLKMTQTENPSEITETGTNITKTVSVLAGDVDLNGQNSISDEVILNRALAGSNNLNDEQRAAADVYKDNNITSVDSEVLMKFLVNNITKIPVTPEEYTAEK